MNKNKNSSQVKEKYQKGWATDTQFWVDYGPLMFNAQSWDDAYFEIQKLVKLLNVESGARVLDSCCGVGRHSIELAEAGMDVTGVDITAPYIEAAKESCESMELEIRFECADVREFVEENQYDYAFNLYTSYGYFEVEEDEDRYLKNILDSLKPGGCFLIDTISKEALARDFVEDEWFEEEGNVICLGFEVIDDFERLVNRWMIIDADGNKKDYKFSHKIYSANEIKRILMKAGFCNVRVYGSLDGDEYDHKVKRLIAVGEKPF